MSQKAPIPFSEPAYLLGHPSPYYTPSHLKWQKSVRAFIEANLLPHAIQWERDAFVPLHVYGQFASAKMLIPNLPTPLPVDMLKKLDIHELPGGLKVEDFDYLHGMIYADEMARSGSLGPGGAITTGMAFGIPPIYKYGSKALQEKFLPDALLGKKRFCIAITEPGAGSDVANVATTAEKTKDGKFYIVNGTKKWITNGIWSDYATMVVRTGGPGATGLSMLVVPLLNTPGVTMRRLKVSGQVSAGTTFIELDDVKVPIDHLIGSEGAAMKYVMQNFNHERLAICIGANRLARVALSSAFEYVLKREAFAKPLIEQSVVRHRLAKAGGQLEMHWAWIESFCYQMTKLNEAQANAKLGGLTALAKAEAGMVLDECARCAVLLFGGNGYTTTGQGEVAERIYREVPGVRIPGGSEDVMLDLAVRQLVKNYQRESALLDPSLAKL